MFYSVVCRMEWFFTVSCVDWNFSYSVVCRVGCFYSVVSRVGCFFYSVVCKVGCFFTVSGVEWNGFSQCRV